MPAIARSLRPSCAGFSSTMLKGAAKGAALESEEGNISMKTNRGSLTVSTLEGWLWEAACAPEGS